MLEPRKLLRCLIAFLSHAPPLIYASSGGSVTATAAAASSVTICPARTINYITHALPQSCFTSSWSSHSTLSDHTVSIAPNDTEASTSSQGTTDVAAPTESMPEEKDASNTDIPPATFMSFEDWKEMMLRRTGQDPQELRSRKPNERGPDSRTPPDPGHAGLGEEDEIYLNFDAFLPKPEEALVETTETKDAIAQYDQQEDEDTTHGYRSKDAGKTCKERFSYSSFDAGATVLKSSPRAKNAKAILAENKDSYMLLECSADAKYVIVELSDDILIDTVVLANFEFFSSMIRHFSVSVSDRYPVKADKWRELGIFEARNSRDIQPFLVEDPQIWAKYIRIDFLTHFGNEYYCPVSLLRVHGSRMLDTWKEKTHQEAEGLDLIDEPPLELEQNMIPSTTLPQEQPESGLPPFDSTAGQSPLTKPYAQIFHILQPTCAVSSLQQTSHTSSHDLTHASIGGSEDRSTSVPKHNRDIPPATAATPKTNTTDSAEVPKTPSTTTSTAAPHSMDSRVTQPHEASNGTVPTIPETGTDSSPPASRTATPSSTGKSRNAGGGAASPANVQEGFFNAITKRLQQVEGNLTLSLKYIEDQSRHMQEALQRGEQKQLTRVTHFLEALNQTVLADLRHLREQYDQIWQSTVIALESHREQSERDILALGSRLNILADEVVFQKRMAIVQAVLLLSCLFLVIFSRGVPISYFAPVPDSMAFQTPSSIPSHRRGVFQARVGITQPAEMTLRGSDELATYRSVENVGDGDMEGDQGPLERQESAHVAYDRDLTPCCPLSPSPTPSPPAVVTESHLTSSFNHGNSRWQSQTRKPLPALPEHKESP
jgi:hypothetical protein